jgi:hypothetical protein
VVQDISDFAVEPVAYLISVLRLKLTESYRPHRFAPYLKIRFGARSPLSFSPVLPSNARERYAMGSSDYPANQFLNGSKTVVFYSQKSRFICYTDGMRKMSALCALAMLAALLMPSVVWAAKPIKTGGSKSPKGGTSEPIGYDISWPQCGKRLPKGQAFGIVGVNGGTAANTNPCLADQLTWANKSVGGTAQPKVQLYVNTANPGEVIDQVSTWPISNTDKTGFTTENPYGECTGNNDRACSWQYGWNRAVEANIDRFAPAAREAGINQAASAYVWWLDVETMNTWQSGSEDALARNTATLEGMTSYFNSRGATVGLYSTAVQWGEITGTAIGADSNLNGLDNWRPSGASLENAKANCSVPPLTSGGIISLTQYVQRNLDHNYSCI